MENLLKTLVRFDQIGHKTSYVLVDLTEDEFAFFSQCHGLRVNVDTMTEEQLDANSTINCAINENNIFDESSENNRKYAGKWEGKVVDVTDVKNIDSVSRLILTAVYP